MQSFRIAETDNDIAKQWLMLIDPTHMTKAENTFLSFILRACIDQHTTFLKGNTNYSCIWAPPALKNLFPDKGYFRLTHTLIGRLRTSDFKEYRFEVHGDKIGHGAYSVVNQLLGTLVLQENNTLQFKTNPSRVVKNLSVYFNFFPVPRDEFAFQKEKLESKAEHEWAMLSRDEDFSAKKPVFFHEGGHLSAYLVMKFIQGKNLNKLIKKDQIDKKKQNHISTDDRIKLCIDVALAFIKVHGLNIKHGDIKPSNIMFNEQGAKVIDYGGSQDVNAFGKEVIFTPIYGAKEILKGSPISVQSDYCSGALVFGLIFRADFHKSIVIEKKYKEKMAAGHFVYHRGLEKEKNKKIQKTLKQKKHFNFPNLFIGISDLKKNHRNAIKKLLKKMVSKNPAKRPTFAEALALFEQIDLERRATQIMQDKKIRFDAIEWSNTHYLAVQLRDDLTALYFNNPRITLEGLINIQELVHHTLLKLEEKPHLIELFIKRTQIHCFAELTSKQGIFDTLTNAIESFKTSLNELKNLQLSLYKLNEREHKQKDTPLGYQSNDLNRQLQLVKDKTLKYHLSIDNLMIINHKFANHISSLKASLEKCWLQVEESSVEQSEVHFFSGTTPTY